MHNALRLEKPPAWIRVAVDDLGCAVDQAVLLPLQARASLPSLSAHLQVR